MGSLTAVGCELQDERVKTGKCSVRGSTSRRQIQDRPELVRTPQGVGAHAPSRSSTVRGAVTGVVNLWLSSSSSETR